MKEIENRLDRPYTSREVLKEALGYGMVGSGALIGTYGVAELEPERDDFIAPAQGVSIKGLVASGIGLAFMLKGGMRAVEVGHEIHDASYEEFEEYLRQQGIREVRVEPLQGQVYRYEPSALEGFGGGASIKIPQGEGYYTVYKAKTANGKDVTFTEQNALLKEGKESIMHRFFVMRNVLTANLRAYQLQEHIPGIEASINLDEQVDGRTYGELLAEARGRGIYAYHRPPHQK